MELFHVGCQDTDDEAGDEAGDEPIYVDEYGYKFRLYDERKTVPAKFLHEVRRMQQTRREEKQLHRRSMGDQPINAPPKVKLSNTEGSISSFLTGADAKLKSGATRPCLLAPGVAKQVFISPNNHLCTAKSHSDPTCESTESEQIWAKNSNGHSGSSNTSVLHNKLGGILKNRSVKFEGRQHTRGQKHSSY